MKPVVVDPDITLEQLFDEFARLEDKKHREAVRDQIIVKMRRGIRGPTIIRTKTYAKFRSPKPQRLGNAGGSALDHVPCIP